MKPVEFHYATDRRCYYGAPCSDLQREIDSIAKAKAHLAELGYHATYYPAGGYYVGFCGMEIVTPDCRSFEKCYHMCLGHFLALQHKCTNCTDGTVDVCRGDHPFTEDHWQCSSCDSTFPLCSYEPQ